MGEEKVTAQRLSGYSDAVFAVIVTIMVLELRAPEESAVSALWPLWPTAISYAVSYLFIAIIWINHHYLMRFVDHPTLRLIWINFIHLFMVSVLPFATAWIARTRLASPLLCFTQGSSWASILLQRLRARSIRPRPRPRHAVGRACSAHRETPITRCPCQLHDRDARCRRRAAPRFRSDMHCPDPSLAARCPQHWAS
jgi:Endosomal/lysosomal potassium channel TMEM175